MCCRPWPANLVAALRTAAAPSCGVVSIVLPPRPSARIVARADPRFEGQVPRPHTGHGPRPYRPGDDRRRHSPHAADTHRGVVCAARCAKSGQTEQGQRGESVDLTRLNAFQPLPDLPIPVGSSFGIPPNYLTALNRGPPLIFFALAGDSTMTRFSVMLSGAPCVRQRYAQHNKGEGPNGWRFTEIEREI